MESAARYIRGRIANACDGCKARKVKCDGKLPCSYCAGRLRPEACHYSPQRRRRQTATTASRASTAATATASSPPPPTTIREFRARPMRTTSSVTTSPPPPPPPPGGGGSSVAAAAAPRNEEEPDRPISALNQAEDETEVPREARLLCDAHGKLTFIGDCAPLSFFQSVRRLVTNSVGQNAFAPHTSRFSVLENAPTRNPKRALRDRNHQTVPAVRPMDVAPALAAYLSTTSSLVDLVDSDKLLDDLLLWANLAHKPDHATSIVNFLVLAIGLQADNDELSQQYFEYARDQAYTNLSDSLSVETVQAFVLVTIYMFCSCQINGAFLFFGVAVRAAYSIGVHRTEVNARFGLEAHRQRDRLWKSLRVVDLFLSTSMGRPPATSDVDCTVPYRALNADGEEVFDLLNASVQILLILEGIVMEIYSRKKISMQLTEGASLQLRDWSARWLRQLKDVIARPAGRSEAQVIGACQVLSSYYYAVMLVSRPFFMYELFRRLADSDDPGASSGRSSAALTSGKSKLADACIDAAILMVEPILDLVERNVLRGKAPLLVCWLFASSLVLGVGLLGGFGRILEKYTRMSIQAMDHFAQSDAHARQYSLIAQSLLTTALEHLESQELQERSRRTENSSQLFGLVPLEARSLTNSPAHVNQQQSRSRVPLDRSLLQHQGLQGVVASPRLGDIDSVFLGLDEPVLHTPESAFWNGILGHESDPSSALNLFPLLEAGGGIDLAHWL